MKKNICLYLIISIFFNCKSQQLEKKIYNETKKLVIFIFDDFNKRNIKNNKVIKDKILFKPSVESYKNWKDLITNSNQIMPLVQNFNSSTNKKKIDYSKIFTQKEINYMSKQVSSFESKKWSDYVGLKPKEIIIREHDNPYQNKIYKAANTYYITQPVFTLNNKYALIYQENGFGGVLIVYQKIKNKWRAVASTSIWVS